MAARFDLLKKRSTALISAIAAAATSPDFAMLGLQSNGHYHCVIAVQGAEILVRCDVAAHGDQVLGHARIFVLPTPPEVKKEPLGLEVTFNEAGEVTIAGETYPIAESGAPFCAHLFHALHAEGKLVFLGLRSELG